MNAFKPKIWILSLFLLLTTSFEVEAQNTAQRAINPYFGSSVYLNPIKTSPFKKYSITQPIKDTVQAHSPRRATIMSAILPGLGQIYNEKPWKVGLIYGGAIGLGYSLKFNLDSMRRYQKALSARVDTSSATTDLWYPLLSDAKVQSERDYYRRNRDIMIIGLFALYALQIVDANVDAHLKEFKVNKELALQVKPSFDMNLRYGFQPSFGVKLKLYTF